VSDEPQHHMAPGLGVIAWQSRLLVYQMAGERIVWARFLGEEMVDISDELRAAIAEDRQRIERS
jgi:hypothetical protein